LPFTKKCFSAVAMLALVAGMVGCAALKEKSAGNAPAINQQPLSLAVYYIKIDNQKEYLIREIHNVHLVGDAAKAAAQELIKSQPATKGAQAIFPREANILSVSVENGLATINFSREVLQANVGSEGEVLGIQSMVNTLTEFPEIKAVSFQVEGKVDDRTKDWWGHAGLHNQPFHRDLSRVFEPAIWVTHPAENQIISVPLLVKGSARISGSTISIKLVDKNKNKIAQEYISFPKSLERNDFEVRLKFQPPPAGRGYLEVAPVGQSGYQENVVTVPVRWQ